MQLDLAAGADDAMPGQVVNGHRAEEACDGAVIERVAGRSGDGSIGAYLSRRNGEDHALEGDVTWFVRARGFAEQVPFGPLGRELIHDRRVASGRDARVGF